MFEVLFQHLRGTLTTALERHLAVEDFRAMDSSLVCISLVNNSSLVNIMKQKWANVAEKISVVQKSEPVL